ncbi:MAG: hypothetical protein HC802_03660 [Caldilineaceae bacterium]|nr:hypothetical protein [Caldilineaceae bacterium]
MTRSAVLAGDVGIGIERTLTQSQYLIWLGQKLHPDEPLYNMVHAFTIHGPIERLAFQQSFQMLVNKSDALRTVIHEQNGAPLQRVVADFPFAVEWIDLSSNPDPSAEFERWLEQGQLHIFDLEQRLFDSVLVKLAADHFVWHLNIHHLIADVVSFALIYRRMGEFYGLALAGNLDQAPDLPAYQDFLEADRAYVTSAAFENARQYWLSRLATPLEPTDFYGKRQVATGRPRAERLTVALGAERTARLHQVAQEKECAH